MDQTETVSIALPRSADVDGLTLVGVQVEAGKPRRKQRRGPWTTDLSFRLTYHGRSEGKLKTRTLKLSIAIQ